MASGFDDDELLSLSTPTARRVPVNPRSPPPQQHRPPRSHRNGEVATESESKIRVGQYLVKRTLGEGSFGKVKLAVHKVSGQEVALKIISRKKLISRDMAGRVEREISYLQLLRHPHIIKLYTVIMTPNEIIMVLEYAGGELFDYLVKYGKLAEDMARRFFQQIVCAVEYCHRHKIVHRDLKPENLLLDRHLNVKIADFGLSNIMTDGNFLKTSCGSPNYAAPEVISGKLYAGPEVDVWSCGIILYVLLVGKLPFDDEFIPALFRKINSGHYHCPSWVSAGPKSLIARMLKTNPVQRITIQEIRQDPWFNEGLEDYLKPPVEEFMDTGIDPNKPIDPKDLAPGKPPEVQEAIHDSVVGKLGKTMGYAKGDIQEALAQTDANGIKDAYLIVRENQIMQSIPTLTNKENAQPFMAASPPAWDTNTPGSLVGESLRFHRASVNHAPIQPLTAKSPPETAQNASIAPPTQATEALATPPAEKKDAYVSKISILASSLPHYHNMFLEQQRKEKERRSHGSQHSHTSEGGNLEPGEVKRIPADGQGWSLDHLDKLERSPEEQAQLAAALKPHSRSTLNLQRITSEPVDLEQEQTKTEKKKTSRWQFGIRSRNQPHEAMRCVYNALKELGAEWEVPEPTKDSPGATPRTYPVFVKGGTVLDKPMAHSPRSGSPEHGRSAAASVEYFAQRSHRFTDLESNAAPRRMVPTPDGDGFETDDEDIDPSVVPDDYVPRDPWCIHVRWRKDGMYPATTTVHPASTHSSRADLVSMNEDHVACSEAPSLTASPSATPASPTPSTSASTIGARTLVPPTTDSPTTNPATSDSPNTVPSPEGSCYVYMDVQLYSIEPGVDRDSIYLVDFKCAGYETLVERAMGESEKQLVGSGYRIKDKDVTSPQPFLDLANRLVIQLASGGGKEAGKGPGARAGAGR